MKKHLAFFYLVFLCLSKTFGCLNYFYVLNKEGHLTTLGNDWKIPFDMNFDEAFNVRKLHKLEKKLQKEKSYMLLSDYAVCLMKLGKQAEALEILTGLYKHYPHDYKLAANLGTAYELNGMNDSALKYIRRDMELNPHDHDGSEWIHVKILEAKKRLKKDPTYLNTHTVLELTGMQKNDSTVLKNLIVQLQERVPFSPGGSDPLMAQLFVELAELSANVRSIEYARVYYQLSKNYYGNTSPAIDTKIKDMEKLMHKYTQVQPTAEQYMEGSVNKLSYFKYTQILTDHSDPHYHIDWNKINTNVGALLAMADLSLPAQALKDSAQSQAMQHSDEFELLPDEDTLKTDSITPATSPGKSNDAHATPATQQNRWLLIGGILALLGLGFFAWARLRK